MECIPVRCEAFWKELHYFKHLWRNRQDLKVEDAGIAALFGLEYYAWYCAGEIVGKGFTFPDPSHGYKVREAYLFLTNDGNSVDRTVVDDAGKRVYPLRCQCLCGAFSGIDFLLEITLCNGEFF
ncbi:ATP synthase G subunit family protein [Medicago truncatula]|uniref:ATP synthase G subunit family protein n=1 Tax=Medicago truncatula TaxID=3880 RepID=G7KAA2_MEDTR|nr:ATP synthase G subunit family protein [Medicago truncatula]